MQYDNYQQKVNKIVGVVRRIVAHLTLIIVVSAVLTALAVAYIVSKGTIYGETDCFPEVIYGDDTGYKAKGFLSRVDYEYCSDGTDEWSEETPKRPGTYKVRAVTKRAFGGVEYSDEQQFELLPKPIELVLAVSAVYGDDPTVTVDLAYDDELICGKFVYSDRNSLTPEVSVDGEQVKIIDRNGNDVTDCYVISTPMSQINIIPRQLSISVKDAEKMYDGKAFYSELYDITKGTVADGDSFSISFKDSLTDVGEVKNRPAVNIINENGENVTETMYEVSIAEGTLKVTKRPVKITTESAALVYNGKEQSADGCTVDPETPLAEGEKITVKGAVKAINCGSYENRLAFEIVDRGYEEKTSNYELTVITGTVKITPAPLTVTSGNLEYVYDGNPHGTMFYTCEGLIYGHSVTASFYTTGRDVGTYTNDMEVYVWDEKSQVVTNNYDIKYNYGTIVITKRPLSIKTVSNKWVYDGEAHEAAMYTVNGLVTNHVLMVGGYSSITNVGKISNSLYDVVILNADDVSGGKDLSSNYQIEYEEGTLEVFQRPVNVKPEKSLSKVYDGQPLGVLDMGIEAEGLVFGHTFLGTVVGEEVTEVGTSILSVVDFKIYQGEEDVTYNYMITYNTEGLTILPRRVALLSGSAIKRYDGTPLVCWELTVYSDSEYQLVDGHFISANFTAARTEIGISYNMYDVASVRVYDKNDKDLTKNYEFYLCAFGTLEVIPAAVFKVTTGSAAKVYDGTPLTNNEISIVFTEGQLLASHKIVTLNTSGSIVGVGYTSNTFSIEIHDSKGKNVTYLYDVIEDIGTLTVEPRPITVYTDSASWVYNGNHRQHESFASVEGLVSGHAVLPVEFVSVLNVGTYDNTATVKIHDSNGNEVTENYTISYVYGTLTITPKDVRVRPGNVSKIYDGMPLIPGDEIITEGLVDSHKVSEFAGDGSITDVGNALSRVVAGSVKIVDTEGNDVTGNYNIIYENGVLTVDPRPIIVTSADASKHYDGTALTCNKMDTAKSSQYSSVGGHMIVANVFGSRIEMGTSPNMYDSKSVKIVSQNGDDVTYNYIIQAYETGTLEVIYAAKLQVTTESDMKYYDGYPLENHNYKLDIQEGKLLDGHVLVVDVTGSITKVGAAENPATAKVVDGMGQDVSHLYQINVKFGTLTVTEKGDEPANMLYGKVYTAAKQTLYLKMSSYGDFVNNQWQYAPEYGKTLPGGYSYNYLTSLAMRNSGMTAVSIELAGCLAYMLPYYMGFDGEYSIPTSDTLYRSEMSDYKLSAYFLKDYGESLGALSGMLGDLSDEELDYRSFVYSAYLNVDEETLNYMRRIIFEQGFDKNSETVIKDVAKYIQKSAKYDLEYDENLDYASNTIIAFLDEYKEGVCRHYASAATMLYRALGIPARYVTGFAVTTEAGEWTEIKTPGHAWVEVYVDGIGWVYVEVTGSGAGFGIPGEGDGSGGEGGSGGENGSGGGSGGGSGSGETPSAPSKIKLEITPKFVTKKYDGTFLYAENRLELTAALLELIEAGYTYSVEVSGRQLEVGTGVSVITDFTLFDSDNNDVTEQFDISYLKGRIRVVENSINIALYQLNKYYDGSVLSFEPGDYEIIGELPTGLSLELKFHIELVDAGMISLSELNSNTSLYVSYKVYLNGVDVTAAYGIVFCAVGDIEDYIPIKIQKRVIELTSGSATAEYNGEELTNDKVFISKGTLVSGHTLKATATGSISNVGSVKNTIDSKSIVILDSDGNDVTRNYEIFLNEGTLTLEDSSS